MISAEYLAGFFDGEGYVYVYSNKRQDSILTGIVNTHFGILRQLQEQFGGTLYPKKRFKVQHSQGWELRWIGPQTKNVLETILPFLIVKKAEVEYLLNTWFPLVRRTGRGHGLSDEEKATRAAVVAEFKRIRAVERKVHQHQVLVN